MICLSCWKKTPPLFDGDDQRTEENWNKPETSMALGTAAEERRAILDWLHSLKEKYEGITSLGAAGMIACILANQIEQGEHLK